MLNGHAEGSPPLTNGDTSPHTDMESPTPPSPILDTPKDSGMAVNVRDSGAEDAVKEPLGEAEAGEEVVVIQDTGFNIKIVTPGLEPFDLPVSQWNVACY